MTMPYAVRYGGGFIDLPTQTTPIDQAFLNAVEAALIQLCALAPGANQVPIWNNANSRFEPALIANAQVAAAAAIAISKLAGYPADATKTLLGDGTWGTATSAIDAAGWTTLPAALTYSTTDGPTFVCTTGGVDLTGVVPLGARLKLTHSAAVKYFIVTAVSATTITFYGGTDYTLAATAITLPNYSREKAPLGFPLDPAKWTETLKDTGNRTQGTPTINVWYNLNALSLSFPIGVWDSEYECTLEPLVAAGTGDQELTQDVTLSTTNSTESDVDWTAATGFTANITTAANMYLRPTVMRRKTITVAVKTPYFLNSKTRTAGLGSINFLNAVAPAIVRARCAYL